MFLMIDKTAAEAGRERLVKVLRTIARIIGIIITVFFLAMLIGDAVQTIHDEGFQGISAESLFILLPALIALAAFIITWWQEYIGGISLVLAYLLLSFSPSVHSIYYEEVPRFYIGMFLFALPYLVTGILFMVASRLSKRSAK